MNKNELYDYNAIFLSLVTQGANLKDFYILKSEDGMELDQATITELQEIFKANISKNTQSAFEIIEKSKLNEKSQKLLKGALRMLGSVEKDSDDIVKEIISKAEHGFPLANQDDEEAKKKELEAKKKLEEKLKKAEQLASDFPGMMKKSIEKFIAKEHRESFDKIMKEEFNYNYPIVDNPAIVAIMKENEKIQKELSDERNIRITKELEAEAIEDYSDLNGNKSEIANILKDADANMSKENVSKMREIFKAASSQIKEGDILKQKGSGLTPNSGEWETIEKNAEVFNKDNKLSKEEAIDKYLETDMGKKAYAEYENKK